MVKSMRSKISIKKKKKLSKREILNIFAYDNFHKPYRFLTKNQKEEMKEMHESIRKR